MIRVQFQAKLSTYCWSEIGPRHLSMSSASYIGIKWHQSNQCTAGNEIPLQLNTFYSFFFFIHFHPDQSDKSKNELCKQWTLFMQSGENEGKPRVFVDWSWYPASFSSLSPLNAWPSHQNATSTSHQKWIQVNFFFSLIYFTRSWLTYKHTLSSFALADSSLCRTSHTENLQLNHQIQYFKSIVKLLSWWLWLSSPSPSLFLPFSPSRVRITLFFHLKSYTKKVNWIKSFSNFTFTHLKGVIRVLWENSTTSYYEPTQ